MTAGVMRFILTLAIVLFVGVLLYIIAKVELAPTMRDIAMVIVGVVLAKFGAVYDFYFGSSDGSKQKTELMADKKPPLDLKGAEL